MEKIGIITLNGNYNFGNKLQNFATQEILKKYDFKVETIPWISDNSVLKRKIKDFIKNIIDKRFRKFKKFDKKINYSVYKLHGKKITSNLNNYYDYFIVGSDQVWNPNIKLNFDFYLLNFANSNKKVSFAASFGVSKISRDKINMFKNSLKSFKAISVREDSGKKIVEELTNRKDVEVIIDPTMLITSKEWDSVLKEPKKIKKINGKKYILNYFLGDLSNDKKNEIERIAKENDCEIINLLDKKDPFYDSGPSEFLWLEKNAFLICTDSFHSCVFAILYDKPFIVFDRKQEGLESINSRIDTLIDKFKLDNRKYDNKSIKPNNIIHDYSKAYIILNEERKKSINYIKKALER